MRIGFLGLGAMGRGIAARLVAAGHDVRVWNRSRGPVDALVAQGAHAAAAAADAARADVVHTMLADDHALESVLGDGGVFAALAPGSVHVNHATISVALARRLAAEHRARGIGYVAAPVFGRPDAVVAGKLQVLAAGAPADVARVRPLLDAIGARVWPVGDAPERANVIKIAGNFMIAAALESMAEATALARAEGVTAHELLDIMTSTLFASPVYQGYGALIADRKYRRRRARLRAAARLQGHDADAGGGERRRGADADGRRPARQLPRRARARRRRARLERARRGRGAARAPRSQERSRFV